MEGKVLYLIEIGCGVEIEKVVFFVMVGGEMWIQKATKAVVDGAVE